MKRFAAIVLLGLATLGMVNRATAEDHQARVTIPFDFSFGRMLLPAGTYTITSPNQITVVLNNGIRSAAVLRSAVAEEDHSGIDKLVFHKFGDQYFLRVILCSTSHLNLEFPASKAEKQAQLNRAGLDKNDRILLALNN
jgi:hypothetical protein